MSARRDEATEAQLVSALRELGLTEYEAGTLVGLVKLGTGTAKDVERVTDVPRTRVYDAVETLNELGLVDVQYTTPRKFTVVSLESVTRLFDIRRENTITEMAELLQQLGTAQPQREQMGVWTVSGRDAVQSRVFDFMDDAEEKIVYMTVDDLLTDEHLRHLQEAANRGVDIFIGGISDSVQERIQDLVPKATTFESLWEWSDPPAGSLLITDEVTALVSVRVNGTRGVEVEETAIWGTGDHNSLVVVLRAIFSWRLDENDLAGDDS